MAGLFRDQIKAGDLLIGTLVTLASPEVTEIMVEVGFDWLFIDCEHAPFEAQTAQALLQAAGDRCPCAIRVPSGDKVWIKKALDIGAAGIIVPQVNSPEQAERVVRLCKYPPQGTRGVGIARAHGYGRRFSEYVERANEAVAVILQAEHIDAVNTIEAIVQVPGIDAILIGPYDLSASLGKTGKLNDPEVRAAIVRITKACTDAGLRLGAFGVTAEAVQPFIKEGFTLIAVGVDTLFLARAAKEALAGLGRY
jgi:2-keto-3-deoxy-L-rhamnonate aldolase RhmA